MSKSSIHQVFEP